MKPQRPFSGFAQSVSRRTALTRGASLGFAAAILGRRAARAQEGTPEPGQCVAIAPPSDAGGIGFQQLIVGAIVYDMPPGPIEIRLSRFTMEPGTTFPPGVAPHPALMYIEQGTTACPGGPGRIGYGPDGTVLEVTQGESVQYTPAGAIQYIPANVPDGAGNEGTELMSSFIIEFVPIEGIATPTG